MQSQSRSIFRLASDWYTKLTGKPSIEQLQEWQADSVEITLEVKGQFGNRKHQGIINDVSGENDSFSLFIYSLDDSGGLIKRLRIIWVKDIVSFTIHESIYMKYNAIEQNNIDPDAAVPEAGIHLLAEGIEPILVNKSLLAERLDYFRNVIFDGKRFDCSQILSGEELQVLLNAINSTNLYQFYFAEKARENITNLFIAANKIQQTSLIIAVTNLIFTYFSRDDFNYFITKNSHPSVQAFLDNFENEMLAWSKQTSLALKNYISCLNFDEIKHSKLCDFNIYKINNSSPQNNTNYKISSKMSEIHGKTIVRMLTFLELCAYRIEKISIPNIALCELDQVFEHLKTNPYLKSIQACLSNLFHPNPQSPSYHIRLEQPLSGLDQTYQNHWSMLILRLRDMKKKPCRQSRIMLQQIFITIIYSCYFVPESMMRNHHYKYCRKNV